MNDGSDGLTHWVRSSGKAHIHILSVFEFIEAIILRSAQIIPASVYGRDGFNVEVEPKELEGAIFATP